MTPIFASQRYTLVDIIATGKKQTPGRLIFVGKPSRLGNGREVISPVSGVVVESRRCNDPNSRAKRLRSYITIATADGVQVRFSQLSARIAKKGDTIAAGQFIGIAGDKGVTVDCIRQGRMTDALAYLDIPQGVREFDAHPLSDEDRVALACGIGPSIREHINRHSDAAQFWRRVAAELREVVE